MARRTLDRRTYLHLAGIAGVTAIAGCGSNETADPTENEEPTDTTAAPEDQNGGDVEYLSEEPDYGGYLEGANSYEQTIDRRGEDTVTVQVGAGGGLAFEPAAVAVSPGTTVQWEWTGDGGGHNVKHNEGPAALDSGSAVDTTGVEYEYTFEETGTTTYYCKPHEPLDMKGAVHVTE